MLDLSRVTVVVRLPGQVVGGYGVEGFEQNGNSVVHEIWPFHQTPGRFHLVGMFGPRIVENFARTRNLGSKDCLGPC